MTDSELATSSQESQQVCISDASLQIDFTPQAISKKTVPRAWERVPTKPFRARHKSQTIWRRFRQSLEMRPDARGIYTARVRGQVKETEFAEEINAAHALAVYVREVKRRCLALPHEDDGDFGVSLYEVTKRVLETGTRRRKYPTTAASDEEPSLASSTPVEYADICMSENNLSSSGANTAAFDIVEDDNPAESTRDIPPASNEAPKLSEPSLVRSALRLNSLDGEDAAVISEFLSRAQAKRAAAMARAKKAGVDSPGPATPKRRALEELDKNSPTPQKSPQKSPEKSSAASPLKDVAEPPTKDEPVDEASPSSPSGRRRSNRLKTSKQKITPAVPKEIPLRRASGKEFVFVKRTEAQELALTTRRNTRHNMGDAKAPKVALQVIAKKGDRIDAPDENPAPTRQRATAKQVKWKEDDKLVEYFYHNEKENDDTAASKSKKKSSKKLALQDDSDNEQKRPATPVRRMTRFMSFLGAQAMPPLSGQMAAASKLKAPGTPVPSQRKKLTPKSPGAGLARPPAKPSARKPGTTSASSSSPPRSGNSKKSGTSTKAKSQDQSVLTKAASRSKLVMSAAPAGSTPMVRKVRAKRIGR